MNDELPDDFDFSKHKIDEGSVRRVSTRRTDSHRNSFRIQRESTDEGNIFYAGLEKRPDRNEKE